MKNTTIFLAIFCLISTFAKAQRSCEITSYNIDIPLTTATQKQLNEINQILNRLSDRVLGETVEESLQSKLDIEISNYNRLNINIAEDGSISGNLSSSPSLKEPYRNRNDGMLRVFAKHIKFNPTADNIEDIKQKASNVIQLLFKKNCEGEIGIVSYEEFRELMKSIAFLIEHISYDAKDGLHNLMGNFGSLLALWRSNYKKGDAILDADTMRSSGIPLVYYTKFIDNNDEKVRWMKGITRYMNRCFTYTRKSNSGIKPDGSGFHHFMSYPSYMGASYSAAIDIIVSLDETSFQVNKNPYLIFRDAIYYQRIIGNDAGMKALSMSGRFPKARGLTDISVQAIGDLAIIGGKILGLNTADPVLAGYINRIVGQTNPEFSYTRVTPFEKGFIQFNNTQGAVYRKDNYLVFFKGFGTATNGFETLPRENMFGRYQSYGAMEIIVPGYIDAEHNGYNIYTYNYNYNPGTTSVVLPWRELGKGIRHGLLWENQKRNFVGSLSIKNKRSSVLTKTFGTYGMFAMDFSSRSQYFGFKKSNFVFSDMIVCLGSDIKGNSRYSTVTTLYQRLANSRNVKVNGNIVEAGSQTFTGANWVISNANNGFYVVNGGNIKVWSGEEQIPNSTSILSNITFPDSPLKQNTYGYIDHGTRLGLNYAEYEYICIPKTTVTEMTALDTKMRVSNNRPYIVHQKNLNAHIVEHKKDKMWGYSLFTANSNINHAGSIIKKNDYPCLVMYQETDPNNILLSISQPDLGFDPIFGRSSSVKKYRKLVLQGLWSLSSTSYRLSNITSSSVIKTTTLTFKLADGLPKEIQLERENKVLFADAGDDQILTTAKGEDIEVTLDGSSSFAPENRNLTYSWTQTSGTPRVTLSDATATMPTFTIPQLMKKTKLVFSLTVTDSEGAVSPADTTTTTVNVARDPDDFITIWTVNDLGEITFPGSGSYTINWGDESTVESATKNISHTYANAGTYTVTASNGITRFNLNNGASKSKLTSIEQWGTAQWTDMFTAFKGASNMVYNATDAPNLSSVTNMDQMFRFASSFNATNLNSWNVSNAQRMNLLFYGASAFNDNISSWNVSNVTQMNAMFSSAKSFNSDISNWDVSKVADMRGMFHNTPAFIQNLGTWFIAPYMFTVNEGVATNTVVGTITTQGGSLTDPTITYTISGGTDREKLSLTSTGQLTINESPSFSEQQSYSIEVTADGSFGRWGVNLTSTRIVTISTVQDSDGSTSSKSKVQQDDDGDGVFNNVDQCDNTPSGESANASGCSQSQSSSSDVNNGKITNSNIKFYPNPAVDLFHIGGLESSGITVQIFAYNGQRVYNKNHKSVNGIVYFSIRDLSAGLYIIRVFGEKAGDNINFKITKR